MTEDEQQALKERGWVIDLDLMWRHPFDYDWMMWDRAEVRNDPAYAGGDAGPQ